MTKATKIKVNSADSMFVCYNPVIVIKITIFSFLSFCLYFCCSCPVLNALSLGEQLAACDENFVALDGRTINCISK